MKPLLRLPAFIALLTILSCARYLTMGPRPSVPARAFLCRDARPDFGLGAYGYLILTHRPGVEDTSRYISICDAFKRNLEPATAFAGITDPSRIMVTYWMLADSCVDQPIADECKTLIDSYDYAQAAWIANAVNKAAVVGPIFVAWPYPAESAINGTNVQALVLDLSRFPEAEFAQALSIWKDRIVRDPKQWQKGFKLQKVRMALRILLNKYGDDIVQILNAG